jgi:glycosidase
MKKLLNILFFGLLSVCINGQVVITDPALPLHNQTITITFRADFGNMGLMDYAGDDVYAHTGVITDKSTSGSDWQHVKAEWTSNTTACKLTKISANEYKLTISPSIREFYNVPTDEKILQLAFVFRNANASIQGKDVGGTDIFVDVYEEGLQVAFIQPAYRFAFVGQGQPVPVKIGANEADSILLYLDNILIKKTAEAEFDTTILASGNYRHELITVAKDIGAVKADTTWFIIPGTTIQETLPSGLEDGITYPANDSVVFVLYAPYKDEIYLIGDFNDWLPDSVYQLKKDGDRFWIAIGNLIPDMEYAFQYLIDQQLLIADPYSEKILDPYNDKDIPPTTYPNLLSYPTTKTQQIAGVIHPGGEAYAWNDEGFTPPLPQDLIIYELLIRDFVDSHDIKDVTDSLDYLQTLGINAIELMPFSEFENNSSWGYNPSFYFAPDKYYGRNTDIKDFIQECHNRGIAVIMDIVLNHAYGQNPMVRMYYNSTTNKPLPNNPWFNQDSPNTAYSWGFDFNHQSAATKYFVDRVVEYWLTEYHVDGFRFDFTKGFTNTPGDGSSYDAQRITILKRIYDQLKSVNQDAYMICEHFAPNSEEEVLSDYGMLLWGNSNYNYNEATMGYLGNSDFSWASYKSRGWSDPHLVSYMESHDEERLMFKNLKYGNSSDGYDIKNLSTALRRMELAGAFYFTIPGPKMIWQFGELGYDISIDSMGRVGEKPIKWDYWNNGDRQHLYLVWAKILDIRKKYPVFQTSDYDLTVGNMIATKKLILRHSEEDAIVIGNFGLATADMQPGYTKTGWWYEVFSGDSVNIVDLASTVSLNAGEYRIYTSKKMESVINGTDEIKSEQLVVYPNPVNDKLFINTDQLIDRLEIYNLAGSKMHVDTCLDGRNTFDVSDLPAGFYMLKMQVGNKVFTGKIVKL